MAKRQEAKLYSDHVETAWRLLRRLSVEELDDVRAMITEHIGEPPVPPAAPGPPEDPSLGVREPRNLQLPSGETGAVAIPDDISVAEVAAFAAAEPEPEPVEAVAAVAVVPDTQLDEPYIEITPKRKPGRPRKSEQP